MLYSVSNSAMAHSSLRQIMPFLHSVSLHVLSTALQNILGIRHGDTEAAFTLVWNLVMASPSVEYKATFLAVSRRCTPSHAGWARSVEEVARQALRPARRWSSMGSLLSHLSSGS